MDIQFEPRRGYAFLQSGGDVNDLARALSNGLVRHMPPPMPVAKVRGAAKAFSFHWSNAQNAWDVIPVKDFPWGLDGAEFILFTGRKALSPLGKSWSLAEMRYVAKKLAAHPGAAVSMESMRRVALRWMARGLSSQHE